MHRVSLLAVAVSLLLALLLNRVDGSLAGLRRVNRLQLLGFDWKNCGQEDDPAVLTSLSLSPDPIIIPGDLSAAASGSTKVELSTPLSVNVTVEKEVAGFWVKVPCVEKVGSCHYPDACAILDELIPPGQECPPPLSVYELPCHCPFKAGSYSLPQTDFDVPHIDMPSWMTNGNYRVQAVLGANGKELGCVKMALALHSN
ncbi:ganglioside GM2 activator [Nelusetta ayraudi]|uniref:ganglioside GM2 activator n=1 Tax=Nelusetta ayraudi TaxID=303726 RepID=UPI003F722B11